MSGGQFLEVKEVVGAAKANIYFAQGWVLINTYENKLQFDDGSSELLIVYVLGKPAN